ncbi:MAG: HAMP domain-containing histidine kinase [Methylocystis sp.]|nr:HAMP domain-containing histidine kinase [Methylocystis sp.]MCA3582660.1 HAMP domain-containing histidine kinase [Methylocystis sp.]MCA3588663.1 HAMP domain-containing histidine kinase [Methylocystis sp.]MCA3591957.1 HAMP domain-containing histidine kinase [Methylocystis sp.]
MTHLTADLVDRRKASEDRRRTEHLGRKTAIHAAREKLTSTTGLAEVFENETLRLFASSKASSCIPLSVYTALIGLCLTFWAPPVIAILWSAISISAIMLGALVAQRLIANPHNGSLAAWKSRFLAIESFQSAVWSSVVVFSVISNGDLLRYFLMVALLIYGSTSSILASSIRHAIYLSIMPVLMGIATLAIMCNDVGKYMLAILGSGALIFNLFLALRVHQTTIESLGFRAEKDALIGALEEANARHDEARRRAEEANLAKSLFLATMSHELRTPLNAILGFSEVMKSELFGPHSIEQYKEYSTDIHSSGEHLLNIINEILDLSRIEAGRYELQEEAVDLAAIAEDCRHMLSMRARAKSINLKTVLESGLPKLWADERAVRQIIINLLGNAIKFTPQGGEVTIKAGWTTQGAQYVAIRDTGPGIPDDELPTVLESFSRGSIAIKTAEQGTGLGLPIVKGLVDIHGGQFQLRSKLREGTEVIVIFPVERVMEPLGPMQQSVG